MFTERKYLFFIILKSCKLDVLTDTYLLMEKLAILRLFAGFPLFGLLLPDIATVIVGSFKNISPFHIYIECSLLVFIIACTLGIAYLRRLRDTTDSQLQ